jgi:hypothetical protein
MLTAYRGAGPNVSVQDPTAVRAILAHRGRSGAPAPPGPAAAPLGPLLDREPVAAQGCSGQRAIAVTQFHETH